MQSVQPISFKTKFVCSVDEKSKFSESNCVVTISVGQMAYEGGRFSSAARLINNHFKACTFMLCDTLQRHNIAATNNSSIEKAHLVANQQGKQWLVRSSNYIKLLSIPFEIIRWDHWLQHQKYQEKRDIIEDNYQNDVEFYNAVVTTAAMYLDRCLNRNSVNDSTKEIFFNASVNYLKEECSVMLLWAENQYNYEIYPSKRNLAMRATHDKFIAPYSSSVLKSVVLDVRSING